MSWTDKELSEMAKAAQAEQSFAYQDSFWNEMEAMLPTKKKKGLPFFWLALIPVVATIGYLAMPSTQSSAYANQAAKTMYSGQKLFAGLQLSESANESLTSFATNQNIDGCKNQTEQQLASKANGVQNSAEIELSNSSVNNKTIGRTLVSSNKKSKARLAQLPSQSTRMGELSKLGVNSISEEERVVSIADFRVIKSPIIRKENQEKAKQNYRPNRSLATLGVSTFNLASDAALQPFFEQNRKTFWNAYVEGGFSMGQSYMTSQVGFTNAFNLGLGARYDYNNYYIQLGMGAELQNVKYELSERRKVYHTSSTVMQNNYSYKQLYRVEAPLTIGYQFPKHLVQLSVIPSYLVGAKMKYEYLEDGTSIRNETIYGDKTAWNDFTTSFALGYGYRLSKTLSLGANLKWQLINQLNKTAETEGKVRPLSGQIFIRKTLK